MIPVGIAWKGRASVSGDAVDQQLVRRHLQTLHHLRHVTDVVAVVEDGVEVELDAGLLLEQRPQRRPSVPRLLGEALHDPVRVVALHALLDQREQHALGEQRAARELQVGGHPVGVHDHPARDAQREVLHVVEQDRRVGQDHALGARVRDVALVPQRHVLEPGLRVAAQHAREAADALGRDRVALVRHRARALLARPERLLDLAHLGALEVADLLREALQPGAGERDRAAAARRGGRAARPGWRPARPPARAARARAPRSPGRATRRCRPRRRSRRSPPARTRAPGARRCGAPRARSRRA